MTGNETDNELRERPLGEVAKELTSDLSLLVRQEIELAKAEMAEKGRTAAPGARHVRRRRRRRALCRGRA